ncbi:MAG: DUF2750 domain-containing protein [Clostridia bacterium]|nr:DUF2750 domain-containing protein [Clostridia bacterium]
MLNNKAFDGIWSSSPEKRYHNFLDTVTDREEVWLSGNDDGCTTFDIDDRIHIMVWPRNEFCERLVSQISENERPFSIEIHEFIEECEAMDDSYNFMVFPTEKDSYIVSKNQLIEDILDYLERLEW